MALIHADIAVSRPPLWRLISRASAALTGLAVMLAIGVSALLLPWPVTVVDGDTVDRWPWRWRLVGFDAPEIRQAKCPAERRLGIEARARLAEMIAGAQRVELIRTTWRLDRWGRVLGRLEIDGRDIATTAIAEGWAVSYTGRGPRQNWCGAGG